MGKEKDDHKMHLLQKQDSFSTENGICSPYLFRNKCLGEVVSYDLCNLKTAYRWVDTKKYSNELATVTSKKRLQRNLYCQILFESYQEIPTPKDTSLVFKGGVSETISLQHANWRHSFVATPVNAWNGNRLGRGRQPRESLGGF